MGQFGSFGEAIKLITEKRDHIKELNKNDVVNCVHGLDLAILILIQAAEKEEHEMSQGFNTQADLNKETH